MAVYYGAGVTFRRLRRTASPEAGRSPPRFPRSRPSAVARARPGRARSCLPGLPPTPPPPGAASERQRAEGRAAVAATPGSTRARSRDARQAPEPGGACELRAAARADGLPGVGWLFAGFPPTASILLMAGPALTWAVIPVAFSPYGNGPATGESAGRSDIDLAALDGAALSAFLYRAHARRRARLEARRRAARP